ncbi:MAG: hydroxyectoine utilization dehydratase EutB [Pseudomonadota bacterium]
MAAYGVGLLEIETARDRIADVVSATPMVASPSLSTRANQPVSIKFECKQRTGSFKLRGATNAVRALSQDARAAGVVGVSTGNHGRGLAYAARSAGARCIVCMSELVPENKVRGIEAEGAEVRTVGRSQDEAEVEAKRLIAEHGMTYLPPFDHADVIAGQGTLGLEILEQAPEATTILCPLSGGGLISGVALAAKAIRPDLRIIGVSMARGAAMHASQEAGRPIEIEELPTLADSLGGGIGLDNRYTFAIVRDLVDEIVLLSEEEIAAAIRHTYWEEREIIEGSGSVAIGAVLAGKVALDGPAVLLVTGRNIDMALHHRIAGGEVPEV